MNRRTTQKGFTLIELILYITIAATVIGGASVFLTLFLQLRVKNEIIADVTEQGAHIVSVINRTIRNAEAITTPTQGTSNASLTVDVVSAGSDPTVFQIASSALTITQGVGSAVTLTNSNIEAAGLTFYNSAATTSADSIDYSFTLNALNPDDRSDFEYEQTFYGTATVKSF